MALSMVLTSHQECRRKNPKLSEKGSTTPTLKNQFKILDQKPFHTFKTQVKLVLACCILHNWILGCGFDEHVPDEEDVTPDDIDQGHGVVADDNEDWKSKRMEWAEAMWADRGNNRF